MRKRWSLHSMSPRATQPVSGTPGMFSPWALSPAKSLTISAQRSKEDIAPWLASGPELTPAIKKSPLCFRQLTRVSGPRHRPAQLGTGQGWIRLSLHQDTMGTEESPKTVHLAPCKATSEEKGAKVFMECEPDDLDVEFSSRLEHLDTPATKRRHSKPWLKGK